MTDPELPDTEMVCMGLHDMILDGADASDIFWLVHETQDPLGICVGAWAYSELWDTVRDHYGGDPREGMEDDRQ